MKAVIKTYTIPLFNMYSLEELVEKTPYSYRYLRDMRSYPDKITPFFRDNISKILQRSQAELFTPIF